MSESVGPDALHVSPSGSLTRAAGGTGEREFSAMLLTLTRVVLPLAIAAAGVVCIIVGGGVDSGVSAVGVALLIVALIVWMINWMFRLSTQSNRDRDREEEARRYFDRHGTWPDE